MRSRLTHSQRSAYQRDGLFFPILALSPAEVSRYRAACDELETELGGKPRTVEVRQMHLHFPWAYELATQSVVMDVVEELLGPNLLIWTTELFIKHPHDAAVAIAWHRDRPYVGLTGGNFVTVWVALSVSELANGCMRVLPRSAELELPRQQLVPGAKEQLPPPNSEHHLVDVQLKAGEFSLHAYDVVHGSSPNRSDEKRIGFVVRFVTPDARPVQGRPPVILARGQDNHGHFTLARPPRSASGREALAGMRASALHHLDVVLGNIKMAGH